MVTSGSRLTSSVAVAEVGEAPDVAQAHAVPNAGQEELVLPVPLLSWHVWVCDRLRTRGRRFRLGLRGRVDRMILGRSLSI